MDKNKIEQTYKEFSEQIYTNLSELEKTVLSAVCFVDKFDIEYCVFVTEDEAAPEAVKSLLITGVLEHVSDGFSVADKYKRCVLNEFQFLNWGRRSQLMKRAIYYWSGKSKYDLALAFCCEQKFWELAAEVLLDCAEEYINAGRFEELHKWFETIPAQYIDQDPLLMVYRVWCFPEYQKINGAYVYLDQVDKSLSSQSNFQDRTHWLKTKVQLLALRGYISRITGNYQEAVNYAQEAVALATEGYPAILSRLYTTIGQDLYLNGDVIAAEASLGKALALGRQYKKHHDVLISLGYSVASMLLSGRLSKAISLYDETTAWFSESHVTHRPEVMVLNDVPIDIYRESFELQLAGEHSEKMLDCCEQTAPALHHLTTHMRRYRMAMNVGDLEQAYEALIQTEAYRDLLDVSWAFGWLPVPVMRLEFELRSGVFEGADRYFSVKEPALLEQKDFSNENERFVYAAWLELNDRYQDACEQLLLIRDHALSEHRVLNAIKAEVQLSLVLDKFDPARAVLHLRDALKLVPEKEKIIGPFLWFGERILPLLNKVSSKLYQDPDSVHLLNDIKDQSEKLWPESQISSLLDQLSKRQVTILRLLVEGDQDKVIAKKLEISPGTVKTHLRTIYRKLDCNNRAQAVSVAMENGLMLN